MKKPLFLAIALVFTGLSLLAILQSERSVVLDTKDILAKFGLNVFEPDEGLFSALFNVSPQQADDILSRAQSLAAYPEQHFDLFDWDTKGEFLNLPTALSRFLSVETGEFIIERNNEGHIDGLVYSVENKSVKCLARFADLWHDGTLVAVSNDPGGFLKLLLAVP